MSVVSFLRPREPSRADLQAEIETLRERIAELERIAFATDWTAPAKWRLTATEARIFGLLIRRQSATQEQVAHAMWSLQPGREFPSRGAVHVNICRMRKKVKRFRVTIHTMWDQGYALDGETRRRLLKDEPRSPCRP